MFEAEVQARDWRLLKRVEIPATLPANEKSCRYTVEVRFPGSAFRATRAAREHLEVVSDRLLLDLVVEVVQGVERDPADLPVWHAYRPPSVAAGEVASTGAWACLRQRALIWATCTLGTRDTGRQVRAGSEGEALALSARVLPGTSEPPEGVAVRRQGNARSGPPPAVWPRRREPMRRIAMLRFPGLVSLVCGAWIAALWNAGTRYWLPAVPFFLAAVVAAVLIWRWSLHGLQITNALIFGAGVSVVAACFGVFAVVTAPDRSVGLGVVVIGMALGYLVATGVWLWVRQSSWARAVPWLLPAVLAFVPGLLPGLGLSLPAFYLDAFSLDLEDVEVPAAMKLVAALKLLSTTLIWLIAPAMLGYLRHTHHMITSRWLGYSTAAFLSVYALLAGVAGLAIQPAVAAGRGAVAAAAAGRTPGSYYGIHPEWVCALPVKDLAAVPTDGGLLDPARPYLSLGDAGGVAVLWDVRGKAALKIPLSALRLVPVADPRQACP
ncbi:hypothetical protein ACFVQ9_13500 [Streptomyces goshikiensis]|uniref:hypothetical protein n=1 Tax=Streptomyces goshikiensis TaxID=1942 RepID=UPI00368DA080